MQMEVHTAERLVPGPSPFEADVADAKLESINCHILKKFEQQVKHYILRLVNSLILFGIKKNCLSSGGFLLLYQFTRRPIYL
jgi:hypothetical protein